MKILLTGSNGFLGKCIFQYLSLDNTIHTLNRESSTYNIDLAMNSPLLIDAYDLVIHSAGKAHFIPKSNSENDIFFKVNVLGTNNLLKALSKNAIPKYFLFISSVSVYGLTSGSLIDETYPLLASDPYGKSKIDSEILIKQWCDKHQIICTILRLPLVVGSNPPGNLGSMIKAIKGGYYFNIDGGNAKKSMVLASDVSRFIVQVAKIGGTYNITDGYHPSFNEISHSIAEQIGKKFVPNFPLFVAKFLAFIGDRIIDKFPINSIKLLKITSSLTFDDSKARKFFNWNPKSVLKEFVINE